MKRQYDFSKGTVRRKPILNSKNTKVQTSIRLDGEIMNWAQRESQKMGIAYQTFLNMKLKEAMEQPSLEERVKILEKKLLKKVD